MYNNIRMKKKSKRRTKAAPKASKKRAARGRKISGLKAAADEVRYSPSGTRDWSTEAGRWYRPIKQPVTLRLDADVIAWFKARGRGYQTRINRALRELMLRERKARPKG
jgi:uncharacterized protein (DUF4415 family)